MGNPLALALGRRDRLTAEEQQALESLVVQTRSYPDETEMVPQGGRPGESMVVIDGFAARFQILESGARQVTAVHVPGDFVDLHSFLLKSLDHGVVALGKCTVAVVPHERLHRITETQPHLTRLLWLATVVDAAIHRAWIVAMGRRSAAHQIAHFICEMYLRLKTVEQVDGDSFFLPFSQAELADIMGKSTVHVNRALQALRRTGAITWEGRTVTIRDWDHLRSMSGFDGTYLSLQNEPR